MKVGDLVRWNSVPHQFSEVHIQMGIVLQFSKTGHQSLSAKILFSDGTTDWINTRSLEVINEGR